MKNRRRVPSAGHTHARKGQRVIVFLRDGSQVRGKFIERTARRLRIEGYKDIPLDLVRTVCWDKGEPRGPPSG